jgi:pimeloyl-ACP methyl ester carboxylesterase
VSALAKKHEATPWKTQAMCLARVLLVLAVALFAACSGDDKPKVIDVPGLPGVLVDVGDHRMYLNCVGEGAPTVILESGFGGDSQLWTYVQRSVNRDTRACSYDRAGIGASPKAPGRRTRSTRTEVEDLERMLDAAEIDPPYILVGHSYGGVMARLFAGRNPDDVVGVVLVDSSHPDFEYRVEQLVRRRTRDDAEGRKLRAAFHVEPFHEGLDVRRSSAQVRAVRSLGAVPLVVLTAGSHGLTNDPNAPVPPALAAEIERLWLDAQTELARLSSDRVHGVVEDSDHFIHLPARGRPEVVVKAIEAVLQAARAETPLPSCRRLFSRSELSCRP